MSGKSGVRRFSTCCWATRTATTSGHAVSPAASGSARDVFYQAPLYPYFLGVIYATVGHSLLAVRVDPGGHRRRRRVRCWRWPADGFFHATVGLIAGIALAVYAPAIFFEALLQKSVLDLFFLSLVAVAARRLLDRTDDRRLWLSLGRRDGRAESHP